MERRQFTFDTYVGLGEAFHLAQKRLDSQRPRFVHFHDYHEVFLVEQGRVRHLINGRVEMLERGAIVFVRPHDTHALQSVGNPPCHIINVACRNETVDHLGERYRSEFRERFFWSRADLPEWHDLDGPRMEQMVNWALELQAGSRTLASVEMFLLTLMICVDRQTAELPATAPAWLNAACTAIRSREVFAEGVRGFVEASRRGHEHVCRETRRHLGLSPSALVNRVRMGHAAKLLREGEYRVEDIAHECGIMNLSHFHRLFKKHYGMTPGNYRKRHLVNPVQST